MCVIWLCSPVFRVLRVHEKLKSVLRCSLSHLDAWPSTFHPSFHHVMPHLLKSSGGSKAVQENSLCSALEINKNNVSDVPISANIIMYTGAQLDREKGRR